MKILVTGGAGYIGAHFVNQARKRGHKIAVVDNFSQTLRNRIKDKNVRYYPADIRDKKLFKVFNNFQPDVVDHFAAIANVAPSLSDPAKYYDVNILGSLNVLDCMRAVDCNKIIFSSTAAIYKHTPDPLTEDSEKNPDNPYGFSKMVIEQVLKDYHRAYGINSISFRPFCASGVDENLEVGCYHNPETQLVTNLVKTFLGQQPIFEAYGNTHPTPDGTAIRDYVHVNDLAEAHLLALEHLDGCKVYNLGMNKGYSLMEMITTAERLLNQKLNYKFMPQRPSDPYRLVGDSGKAERELGWKPKRTIEDIIMTDYNFFKSL